MNSLFVETESGSSYQFLDGKMRRVNAKDILRKDAQWVEYYGFHKQPKAGQELVIFLEPPLEVNDPMERTIRLTTPVTSFYWEDYLV
jgi:hypothetical protein